MKIADCYLRALQKAEENMTNGGIKLDKARFVQLFNDEQNRLVRYILDKKNEEDIRYIQSRIGLDELPPALREMALLRLEYPDTSLKDLGELCDPPVGNSGVNHRLRKLGELAKKLGR